MPARGVHVDPERLAALASLIARRGKDRAGDFASDAELYPPPGDLFALDFFFALTLHQFAFWRMGADGRWEGSYFGLVDGHKRKGSDFVWACGMRARRAAPERLTDAWWAQADDDALAGFFAEDDGATRLPWLSSHIELGRGYARTLRAEGQTPAGICETAKTFARPANALLERLARLPGYGEDPLRKKAMLLAFILIARPEEFLGPEAVRDEASLGPVVDYHVMRTALRTGLVRIENEALRDKIIARAALAPAEEGAVRAAVFEAMRDLARSSGATHAALDALFFAARRRCPEAEPPDCPICPLEAACAKEKDLFQPVRETTFY